MSLTLYCGRGVQTTKYTSIQRQRSGAVGSDTALQDGRSRVRLLIVSLEFFYRLDPSGRTVALE